MSAAETILSPEAVPGASEWFVSGWHRLTYEWDCYGYANTLSESDRKEIGYVWQRYKLAHDRHLRTPNAPGSATAGR